MLKFFGRVFFASILTFVSEVVMFMISLMTFCHLNFEEMSSLNFYVTSSLGFLLGGWLSFRLIWNGDYVDDIWESMVRYRNY